MGDSVAEELITAIEGRIKEIHAMKDEGRMGASC